MTKVSIMPVPSAEGTTSYCAVAGDKYSRGDTAGKALDALSAQLSQAESGTLVVVQNLRADQFFNGPQQQRLGELMSAWRTARDQDRSLSAEEQAELNSLIEAEVLASASRSGTLADELGR